MKIRFNYQGAIFLLLISIFNLLFTFKTISQISYGGIPKSFQATTISRSVQTVVMSPVNIDSLIQEDSTFSGGAFRYGYLIPVDFGLTNIGTWDTLEDGGRLWRLEIISNGALGIELIYDSFWLPDGANFFLYNENKSVVIGAFTSKNNKEGKKFATMPIENDKIIF